MGYPADVTPVATVGRTLARLAGVAVLRAVAVLSGVAIGAAVLGVTWGAHDVALAMHAPETSELTLAGSVDGLAPGVPGTLRLTATNAADSPARVATVTATVTGVSNAPASCTDRLVVGAWHGALTVPGGGTAAVTVPVTLPADVPAACAGATWALRYTAY